MLSYASPTDQLWGIPVVLYFVWTVVLLVSSLIVVSCLQRETKKFHKRVSKTDSRGDLVTDIRKLEMMMARYVQQFLGQGLLDKLSMSGDSSSEPSQSDKIRSEIKEWFTVRAKELESMNYTEKSIKRIILAAIRTGLTRHPLDLRGSRRALEAAKIFLEVDTRSERLDFLNTKLVFKGKGEEGKTKPGLLCPTGGCQWVAENGLKSLNLLVTHPSAIPAIFVFISFVVWLSDILTDAVIIQILWDFKLPIMYPVNESMLASDVTYLSYQTLTIDLYAPLLMLILLFSLMYTLMSCSCSRISDRYKLSSRYNKANCEIADEEQDPTTVLARYEFQIIGAVTSSLVQFCLQFGSYMVILYMLETLARLNEDSASEVQLDKGTRDTVAEKIEEFGFKSLWLSGVASGLSLCVAQYSAFKIQHEHDMTLSQRFVYFMACVFNTVAMMTTSLMFIMAILLPVSEYIGRYHIMILVILLASVLGVGILVSAILAMFGMDPTSISTDKVVTSTSSEAGLTAVLRFSQVGKGRWAVVLGSVNIIGKLFSLITINLFLPPSQLLVHPFSKFYTTSPRSPALHYAIAKQLMCYNILMVITAILLAVDINIYGFNYNLSSATANLLVAANVTGVPFIFLSLLILFKFYSSYDIWTSNGVHLVYQPDSTIVHDNIEAANGEDDTVFEKTNVTEIHEDTTLVNITENDETLEGLSPNAESTILSNGDTTSSHEEEATEADRGIKKKQKKIKIIKTQTKKLNKKMRSSCCSFVVDAADVVVGGCWVNVSD